MRFQVIEPGTRSDLEAARELLALIEQKEKALRDETKTLESARHAESFEVGAIRRWRSMGLSPVQVEQLRTARAEGVELKELDKRAQALAYGNGTPARDAASNHQSFFEGTVPGVSVGEAEKAAQSESEGSEKYSFNPHGAVKW